MTKEQEEAIADVNALKEMYECLSSYRKETDSHYKIFKRRTSSIETVLSMLEEKDKQKKNTYIGDLDGLIKLQQEITIRDKVIDLMVKFIARTDTKDICNNIKQHCVEYVGENKMTCDECIKQYFENEAKEK